MSASPTVRVRATSPCFLCGVRRNAGEEFWLDVDDYPAGLPACLEEVPATAATTMQDVADAVRQDQEARRRGLRR